MSKLLKLKEWLTLDEAVQYISKQINENISVQELYRFALEDYLKLSVYFVNYAYGVKGELREENFYEFTKIHEDIGAKEEVVESLKGIWDLTMKGLEAVIIKGYFEQSNSGIEVKESSKNGIILEQGSVIYQLYEPFERDRIFSPEYNKSDERRRAIEEHPMRAWENHPMIITPLIRTGRFGLEYLPCNNLPENNCVLIIRKNEVTNFIQSLESTSIKQKVYKKNASKLAQRKAKTQKKYKKWHVEAIKLKKQHNSMSKRWISKKIAKMAIAEGASSDTIYKNMDI